ASVGALFSLALELDFEPPDVPQGSAAVVEIWPLSVHDTTVYRWATAPVRMPLDRPESGAERLLAVRVGRLCGREPRYLHSTSWRLSDSVVTLTYVAIVDAPPGDPTRWVPVEPSAPSTGAVGEADVLHHALGHLAFLAAYRPVDAELFADG